MARRKTTDIQENVNEQGVVIDDTVEKQDMTLDPVITETVDKLLSIYPDYQALYIDSKGGVYPEDAKPNAESDAILYQNPYYKS